MSNILLLLLSLHQASFDCRKATHPVEKKICSDQKLSELDDSLGSSWKHYLAQLDDTNAKRAKSNQKDWLNRIRKVNPPIDSLKKAWRERNRSMNFLVSFVDLSEIFVPKSALPIPLQFRMEGDCPGYPGDEEAKPAFDVLRLTPAVDGNSFQFELVAGIGQHMCNSCGLEGVAKRSKANGSNVWNWSSQDKEAPTTAAFRFTTDSVIVKVNTFGTYLNCGMGAEFPDSMIFRKSELGLPN